MRKLLTYTYLLLFCVTILACGTVNLAPEQDIQAATLKNVEVSSAQGLPTAVLPMAVSEEVGVSAERLERIRPVMQDYVDKGNLPGFLTVVARRGKIVFAPDAEKSSILKPSACKISKIRNPSNPIRYSVSTPCQNRLPVSR